MDRKPSKRQILDFIRKLEKKDGNYYQLLGELGITGVGALGAGAVAVTAGSSVASIPIITALTGFGVVVAAPIALVAGAAAAGGAVTYGITRAVVRNASEETERCEAEKQRNDIWPTLHVRLDAAEGKPADFTEEEKTEFILFLKAPLILDLLTPGEAKELIEFLERPNVSLYETYSLLRNILNNSQKSRKSEHQNKKSEEEKVDATAKHKKDLEIAEQKLLARLLGDREKMERLIQLEQKQNPTGSRLVWINAVNDRLDRDNW